jgi:hypothetical protein
MSETCYVCGKRFTAHEWDRRHTDDATGEDVHERCCERCNPKPLRGETRRQARQFEKPVNQTP